MYTSFSVELATPHYATDVRAHLAIDVTKESHCLVKDLLEFLLRCALVAAPKFGVDETCYQLRGTVLQSRGVTMSNQNAGANKHGVHTCLTLMNDSNASLSE